jgi:hypothetical protein
VDTISDILKVILSPLISVITVIITIIVANSINRTKLWRERIEKLYAPIFITLEKHLFRYKEAKYKNPTELKTDCAKAYTILKSNIFLANSAILGAFSDFMQASDDENYNEAQREILFTSLSNQIIYHYNEAALKSGLFF